MTTEQQAFVAHEGEAFIQACPGAGKTKTIVARLARIAAGLPPRKGIAVLSFTNSAVDEFKERCGREGLDEVLRYPSFIGTFDGFVRHFLIMPGGLDGVAVRPTILDSWATLEIEIRLRGRQAFLGPGISLDSFHPETGQIDYQFIGHPGLRRHAQANQAAYEQAAAIRRRGLWAQGYLSAADARVHAVNRLGDEAWSTNLGRAIAARFAELIVDEAQDCNPLDLRILEWLRQYGMPVTLVCDPDQAIYGFRHGTPLGLQEFRGRYQETCRLSMTGNFRSSPPICKLAATLRERAVPDDSIGETADVTSPILVLEYGGAAVPSTIGTQFVQAIAAAGINLDDGIVLAHSRNAALRAAGLRLAGAAAGASKVAWVARMVSEFWTPTQGNRTREASLRAFERLILDVMGKLGTDEDSSRAAERNGIERRWLRRTALELLLKLPKVCPDTEQGREAWIATLRLELQGLGLPHPAGFSAGRYFTSPRTKAWSECLGQRDVEQLRGSTIHEAKGRQYEAVCLVIPPDRQIARSSQVLTMWENRSPDEAKRVIFVGVTRARRFLAVAVPAALTPRVLAILTRNDVPHRVQRIPDA